MGVPSPLEVTARIPIDSLLQRLVHVHRIPVIPPEGDDSGTLVAGERVTGRNKDLARSGLAQYAGISAVAPVALLLHLEQDVGDTVSGDAVRENGRVRRQAVLLFLVEEPGARGNVLPVQEGGKVYLVPYRHHQVVLLGHARKVGVRYPVAY